MLKWEVVMMVPVFDDDGRPAEQPYREPFSFERRISRTRADRLAAEKNAGLNHTNRHSIRYAVRRRVKVAVPAP
jgi:hypothetical protein